eukprot:scaffold376064_cov35-Attheya_sp.AAC.1
MKGIKATSYFEEFVKGQQTHCVVDIWIANVDAGSYLSSTMEKVIYCQEMEKKRTIFKPVWIDRS